MRKPPVLIGLLLAVSVLFLGTVHAKVKVKIDFDPKFDFTKPQTWTWDDKGAGRVIVARTAADDSEEIKGRAEPVNKDIVTTELAKGKPRAKLPELRQALRGAGSPTTTPSSSAWRLTTSSTSRPRSPPSTQRSTG